VVGGFAGVRQAHAAWPLADRDRPPAARDSRVRRTTRERAAAEPRRVRGTPQQPYEYEQMLIRPVVDPDVG
jgi:hypothetical protein